MSDIAFRKASYGDCLTLARYMRDADKREIYLMSGSSPEEALVRSFMGSSTCITVTRDGWPILMAGVAPWGTIGAPWLLAADQAEDHPKRFLKDAIPFVEGQLAIYGTLANFVHAENHVSINWLSRLGFSIGRVKLIGKNGGEFHLFEKTQNV